MNGEYDFELIRGTRDLWEIIRFPLIELSGCPCIRQDLLFFIRVGITFISKCNRRFNHTVSKNQSCNYSMERHTIIDSFSDANSSNITQTEPALIVIQQNRVSARRYLREISKYNVLIFYCKMNIDDIFDSKKRNWYQI